MKTKLFLFALFAVTLSALAQSTNSSPVTPSASTSPVSTLLLTIIPLLVPIVVAIGKSALPKVPTWLLPILAPALGALIDYLGSLATGGSANPIAAAILGSAGVGLREIVDQVKQRVVDGPRPETQ